MPKKSKKQPMSRALIMIVLILIGSNVATVFYFTVLNPSVPLEDVPRQIGNITGDSAESYIGQTVTLSAYLVFAAGHVLLIQNLLDYMTNSINPDNSLVISGSGVGDLQPLAGHQVHVKGVVGWAETLSDFLELSYLSHRDLPEPSVYNCTEAIMIPPMLVNFTPLIDDNPTKYAVLYSGGWGPGSAYYRYWNNIAYTYLLLRLKGYAASNIYVVYKDGAGGNDPVPVDYPATHNSMETVFGILSAEMGIADTLFFYTTNHGQEEGICTWTPLDPDPLLYTEVQTWVDSITCEYMIIVMNQCYSGGFISYLSAANRIIMTSCEPGELSWVCNHNFSWDEFTFHFLTALYGFPIDVDMTGVTYPVWADLNGNGVSMGEAFGYACYMDSQSEVPLYDDNGDGIPSTVGNIVGTDTDFGNGIYL